MNLVKGGLENDTMLQLNPKTVLLVFLLAAAFAANCYLIFGLYIPQHDWNKNAIETECTVETNVAQLNVRGRYYLGEATIGHTIGNDPNRHYTKTFAFFQDEDKTVVLDWLAKKMPVNTTIPCLYDRRHPAKIRFSIYETGWVMFGMILLSLLSVNMFVWLVGSDFIVKKVKPQIAKYFPAPTSKTEFVTV